MERVFSTGARLINGGLDMIIKGVPHHQMSTILEVITPEVL